MIVTVFYLGVLLVVQVHDLEDPIFYLHGCLRPAVFQLCRAAVIVVVNKARVGGNRKDGPTNQEQAVAAMMGGLNRRYMGDKTRERTTTAKRKRLA